MPVDHQNERPQSPTEGDDRTPDKTIGQVKYAAGQKLKKQGGDGGPEVTDLEPEKQGGGQEQPATKERAQQADATQTASKAYAPSSQDAKG